MHLITDAAVHAGTLSGCVGAHVIPWRWAHGIPQVVDPCVDVLPDGLLLGVVVGAFLGSVAGTVHEYLVAGVDESVQN